LQNTDILQISFEKIRIWCKRSQKLHEIIFKAKNCAKKSFCRSNLINSRNRSSQVSATILPASCVTKPGFFDTSVNRPLCWTQFQVNLLKFLPVFIFCDSKYFWNRNYWNCSSQRPHHRHKVKYLFFSPKIGSKYLKLLVDRNFYDKLD